MYYCQYIGIGSWGIEFDLKPHAEKHGDWIKGMVCVCVWNGLHTRIHKHTHKDTQWTLFLGCLFIFFYVRFTLSSCPRGLSAFGLSVHRAKLKDRSTGRTIEMNTHTKSCGRHVRPLERLPV